MLYKFKSKATGDLIMLDPDGRRMLQIMGREGQDKGIFLVEQLQGAIEALEQAVADEEAWLAAQPDIRTDAVVLKQRAQPMLKLLRRCKDLEVDLVWGV